MFSTGKAKKSKPSQAYADRNREKSAKRSRQLSEISRDIGAIPPVKDPARRAACEVDLALFLKTYFPATFSLPFCADHRVSIAKMQKAITHGGLFSLAEPRGSGKTSRCEGAAIYAVLNGFHPFVLIIGSASEAAIEMLDSIKSELEQNELLLEDYPEAIYPIRQLAGEPRRCKGQTYHGRRTLSRWSQDVIVMPTIPGSKASSAIIRVAGITGRIRGMKFKRPDGQSARPTLVIPDDVQTDESANSESQCRTRERTLAGAILGLAGPGKRIAGVMPCTVIRAGDVADRMLDSKLHPEWDGSRFRLMYQFPTNEELWGRYKEIAIAFNPSIPGDKERAEKEATEFYRSNREAMDVGAVIAWPERYEKGELSAIQHAMNLLYRDERAFWAEYQNAPLPDEIGDFEELTADTIMNRLNRVPRGQVPIGVTRLTAFIDVQGKLLFYAVVAWQDDFTGHVIDYGTWPEQTGRKYFSLVDAKKTIAGATKIEGLEAQIYAALEKLTIELMGREWPQGGAAFRIDRCLIDSGWGDSTNIVFQFCRQSPFAANLTPSKGVGITAANKSIGERPKKDGERAGLEWYMPVPKETRGIRMVHYDTNFWKTLTHSRLRIEPGNSGCLSLYGSSPQIHQLIADHLTSEYRVRTEGRGRTVDVWQRLANRENHYLDCIVGCAVAASMQGVGLQAHAATSEPKRKWMSLEELKARARGR